MNKMESGSSSLSRKNYEQLCNEMRSLPIRMKDRRELYEELEVRLLKTNPSGAIENRLEFPSCLSFSATNF